MGFGVAGGGGVIDPDCERRNWVALMHNIGQSQAAIAYGCMVNPEIKAAVERTGKKCWSVSKVVSQEDIDHGKAVILQEIWRYQEERDKKTRPKQR